MPATGTRRSANVSAGIPASVLHGNNPPPHPLREKGAGILLKSLRREAGPGRRGG